MFTSYAAENFVIGGVSNYTILFQVRVLHFSVGFAGASFGVNIFGIFSVIEDTY